MDDIFYHSQARMLQAIEELGREVDTVRQRMMLHGGIGTEAISDRGFSGGTEDTMMLWVLLFEHPPASR